MRLCPRFELVGCYKEIENIYLAYNKSNISINWEADDRENQRINYDLLDNNESIESSSIERASISHRYPTRYFFININPGDHEITLRLSDGLNQTQSTKLLHIEKETLQEQIAKDLLLAVIILTIITIVLLFIMSFFMNQQSYWMWSWIKVCLLIALIIIFSLNYILHLSFIWFSVFIYIIALIFASSLIKLNFSDYKQKKTKIYEKITDVWVISILGMFFMMIILVYYIPQGLIFSTHPVLRYDYIFFYY